MTENFGTVSQPQTLGELTDYVDSSAKTYVALMGENLGHPTLKFSLPLAQFIEISAVGNRRTLKKLRLIKVSTTLKETLCGIMPLVWAVTRLWVWLDPKYKTYKSRVRPLHKILLLFVKALGILRTRLFSQS